MQLDIWSDIACPWCYVGKRRLEAALEAFEGSDDVQIRWRSFELDPSAPAEGYDDNAGRLASKYGVSREEALARMQQLTEVAAADGLDLSLPDARGGNTFDGHRLVHLAAEHGLQNEMKERLLHAFHSERAPIADHEVLARLAAEVGLPVGEVAELLSSDRYADDVREDEQLAAQLGVQGVPCFVIDRKYGITGAQPPETLLAALDQAASQTP
jgi:predicted DsbA family dithiol-disulfide isomerase